MPGFMYDVQGPEITIKTPDGVIDAVNGVSFRRVEDKTMGVAGASGNPGPAAGVIGVKADRIMLFPMVSYAAKVLFKVA